MSRTIILLAHNVRSCHNVGSLLRTADGLGVKEVFLTGYTPYPLMKIETRLSHLAQKLNKQISKTALGAERSQPWEHVDDIFVVLEKLRAENFQIAALEQAEEATALPTFKASDKIALIVGREVEGLEPEVVKACDLAVEIPMFGYKESFNVVQAAAMALYQLRFK